VPLVAVLLLGVMAGIGTDTFGLLWDTMMQQEIPQDRLSRVYSYDALLGSFALIPLGLAAAPGRSPRSSARERPCSRAG
jgi:hypothetical protein